METPDLLPAAATGSAPSGADNPDGLFGLRRTRRRTRRQSSRESGYDRIILTLVLLAPVLGAWLFGGIRVWSTGTLLIFTFAAGILFGLRPWLFRAADRPAFPAALPALGLFLAYCAATVPFAATPYDAAFETARFAGLLLVFWITADLAGGHHNRWRWLAAILLLTGSIMALYALIQHNRESNLVLNLPRPAVYGDRASGAFICPNHFASYIALLLPLALALLLCRDSGHVLLIICIYTLAVVPPALYLTQSRSGWLGALAGLAVTGLILAARRSWRAFCTVLFTAPLAIAALALAAWHCSPMARARIADALQGNPRLQIWQDTLAMIRDTPLTGHGPASYRWIYPKYWHEMKVFMDPEHAHNETLEALAEHGPLGFTLLAIAIAILLGHLILRLRRTTRDKDAALIAAALGAATTAFVHSCFDFNLRLHSVSAALLLLLALPVSALITSRTTPPREKLTARPRRLIAAATALFSLLLLLLTARHLASDLYLRLGETRRHNIEYDAAERAYQTALTIAPHNHAAHLSLAHLLRTRATWELDPTYKRTYIETSRHHYHQTLHHNPHSLDARVSLALLEKLTGNTPAAIQTLRDLVAFAPNHRDNQVRLALLLRETGQTNEARQIFLRAQTLGTTQLIELNLRALQQNP